MVLITHDNSIMDYIKFSLSCPVRVGKSYLGLIVYGLLFFIITVLIINVTSFITTGSSMPMEITSPIDMVLFKLIMAPTNFMTNLFYYCFISMIIYVSLDVERVKYVLPSDIRKAAKKHYKSLFSLIILFWIGGFMIELLFGFFKEPNSLSQSESYLYIVKPFLTMSFMISVSVMLMTETKVIGSLKILMRTFNTARYPFLILMFIYCVASHYLPLEMTRPLQNLIVMSVYEVNSMEVTNTIITINFVWQILNVLVFMIITTIPSAAAIFLVRTTTTN